LIWEQLSRCENNKEIRMNTPEVSQADLRSFLESMWLIRAFEEKASEIYARGKINGLLHLGMGLEGVATGAASAMRRDDYVFGGHRAHAHAIARGADITALMAELAGRSTGCCKGKGGTMHLSVPDVGFVTATGVVAGNIPLALGAALSCREAAKGQVAAAVFGDGAGQAGVFHESLNIASLWKLPMLFICENNGFAEFTPLSEHTLVERLSEYAVTYGIPRVTVDGNDVLAVRAAIDEAVQRGRAGDGPSFVECLTHRLRGHYEGSASEYDRSELDSKDVVKIFERQLAKAGDISEEQAAGIAETAHEKVAAAADAALDAPWPDAGEVTSHVLTG
jgi:TPP-dependent pyruvate/acetoin dehydrogenase alpha subunit